MLRTINAVVTAPGSSDASRVAQRFAEQVKAEGRSVLLIEPRSEVPGRFLAARVLQQIKSSSKLDTLIILRSHLISACAFDELVSELAKRNTRTQIVIACDCAVRTTASFVPITESYLVRRQKFVMLRTPLRFDQGLFSAQLAPIIRHHMSLCVSEFIGDTELRALLNSLTQSCLALYSLLPQQTLNHFPKQVHVSWEPVGESVFKVPLDKIRLVGVWTETFEVRLKHSQHSAALESALSQLCADSGIVTVLLYECDGSFHVRGLVDSDSSSSKCSSVLERAIKSMTQIDETITFTGGVSRSAIPVKVHQMLETMVRMHVPSEPSFRVGEMFVATHDFVGQRLDEQISQTSLNTAVLCSCLGETGHLPKFAPQTVVKGTLLHFVKKTVVGCDSNPVIVVRVLDTALTLIVPLIDVCVGGCAATLGYSVTLTVTPLQPISHLNLKCPAHRRLLGALNPEHLTFHLSRDLLMPNGGSKLYSALLAAMEFNNTVADVLTEDFVRLVCEQQGDRSVEERIRALFPPTVSPGFLPDDVSVLLADSMRHVAKPHERVLFSTVEVLLQRHPTAVKGATNEMFSPVPERLLLPVAVNESHPEAAATASQVDFGPWQGPRVTKSGRKRGARHHWAREALERVFNTLRSAFSRKF